MRDDAGRVLLGEQVGGELVLQLVKRDDVGGEVQGQPRLADLGAGGVLDLGFPDQCGGVASHTQLQRGAERLLLLLLLFLQVVMY